MKFNAIGKAALDSVSHDLALRTQEGFAPRLAQ